MIRARSSVGRLCALLLGAAAMLPTWSPAAAAPEAKRAPASKQKERAVDSGSLGSFTPSLQSPTLRSRPGVNERAFRFTPSGQTGDRRGVTVDINTRALTAPTAVRSSERAAGYDLGVALGLRGVSLTGGMSKLDAGLARSESVSVGLGYGERDWNTSLKLGSEDRRARGAEPLDLDRRYSIELGGAYSLSQRFSLSGGVRYRLAPEGETPRVQQGEDDGAVFVGTAVSF